MKAAVLEVPQMTIIKELSIPEIEPDEALVQVKACGVCLSEFDKWEGTRVGLQYPLLMGHEACGVITQLGVEVSGFKIGDRVAVMPTRLGQFTQYTNGGFAQYLSAPGERLALIPENIPFTSALGEPIACIVSGFKQSTPYLGKRAAVIGCGFMGLMIVQLLAHQGVPDITAVDIRQDALDNALQMGAHRAVFPDDVSPEDRCVEWKQFGQGFDVVYEVTGVQAGLSLAGEMVKVHGVLSIVGFHTGAPRIVDVALWNVKAITVINAHERRNDVMMESMRTGLDLVSNRIIQIDRLVTHTFPLDCVDEAFRMLKNKPAGFVKAIVIPWD
jgi:2-desacetyl-2-hydroxyethyl bacteriochlorophyllide A dehydrogenase